MDSQPDSRLAQIDDPALRASLERLGSAIRENPMPWKVTLVGGVEERFATQDDAARAIDATGAKVAIAENLITGQIVSRANGAWTEKHRASLLTGRRELSDQKNMPALPHRADLDG